MMTTNYDILDLVTIAVSNLPGKTPDVRLSGNNIFIGNKPMPISDIKATKYSALEFVKLISRAM